MERTQTLVQQIDWIESLEQGITRRLLSKEDLRTWFTKSFQGSPPLNLFSICFQLIFVGFSQLFFFSVAIPQPLASLYFLFCFNRGEIFWSSGKDLLSSKCSSQALNIVHCKPKICITRLKVCMGTTRHIVNKQKGSHQKNEKVVPTITSVCTYNVGVRLPPHITYIISKLLMLSG